MRSYEIGLSALRAQQTALATHGHNIANANTPGYARQVVDVAERRPFSSGDLQLGAGVDVVQIRSLREAATESALGRNTSLSSAAQAKLEAATNMETLLTPGDASVHAYLSNFFNSLETVANAPEESATRGELVRNADALMKEGGYILNSLDEAKKTAALDHRVGVEKVNVLIKDLVQLNRTIFQSRAAGGEPHTQLSNRDALLADLGQWIDVSIVPLDNGGELVLLGGGATSFSTDPITLTSVVQPNGDLSIQNVSNQRFVQAVSGRLRGLEEAHDSSVTGVTADMESMLRELVRQVDQLHATGLVSPDGYQSLVASRSPAAADVPFLRASLPFSVEQGTLYVSVTDRSTGARTTHEIEIDPITDSLNDISHKLNADPGLNYLVVGGSNQLIIRAGSGFSFDFAGRPDNAPDRTAFAGTADMAFAGSYTGDTNDRVSVTFTSSGQIGLTEGLAAEVRDANGTFMRSISPGADYVPGSPLDIGNGLKVSFGAGSVVAGDTVGIAALSDPDETGILSALGLNSFFTGTEARNFEVREDLRANPRLMAMSRTGEPGDASNVAAMADLRDIRFEGIGTRTFVETLADLTADAGLDVQQLQNEVDQLESFGAQLRAQRDSVSGVDTNEELLRLLATERAFQAAARFVTIFDETVVELLGLVG